MPKLTKAQEKIMNMKLSSTRLDLFPKLDKAQEKRLEDKFYVQCGSEVKVWSFEHKKLKQHLAKELSFQKKGDREKLEKRKIKKIDEGRLLKNGACAGCGYWLDDECNCKGINIGIDQAIKAIK